MYMIPVTLRYVFILKEPKILKNKTNKVKKTAYGIIKIQLLFALTIDFDIDLPLK